jgi:hypothetical protein
MRTLSYVYRNLRFPGFHFAGFAEVAKVKVGELEVRDLGGVPAAGLPSPTRTVARARHQITDISDRQVNGEAVLF